MKRIVLHSISVMILMTILVLTTAQANPQPREEPNIGDILVRVVTVLEVWKPNESLDAVKASADAPQDYNGDGKIDILDIRTVLVPLRNISPHYPAYQSFARIRSDGNLGRVKLILRALDGRIPGIPSGWNWEKEWVGKIKDILLPRSDIDKDEDTDFDDIVSVANILAPHRESLAPYRIPLGTRVPIIHVWANTTDTTDRSVNFQVVDIYDLVQVAEGLEMMSLNLEAATTALLEKGKDVVPADIDNWLKTAAVKGSTKAQQALTLLKRAFANVNEDDIVDYADLVEVGNAIFAGDAIPVKTKENVNRDMAIDINDIVFVTTYIDAQTNVVPVLTTSVSFRYRDISKWTLEATKNNKTTAAARLTFLMAHLLPQWANVNGDTTVDFSDLIFVGNVYSKIASNASVTTEARATADADGDKVVDIHDIILVAQEAAGNPETAVTKAMLVDRIEMFTQAEVDKWIKQIDSVDPTSIHYPATVKNKAKSVLERLKAALPVRSADVDGSGTIDVVDLIKVANAVKNPSGAPAGADADGSGSIDSADIIFVAKAIEDSSTDALRPAAIETGVVFKVSDVDEWIGIAKARPDSTAVVKVLKQLRHAPPLAAKDVNRDKKVDFKDLIIVGNAITRGTAAPNTYPDIDENDDFDAYDIIYVVSGLPAAESTALAARTALQAISPEFTAEDVDPWINKATESNRPTLIGILKLLKNEVPIAGDIYGNDRVVDLRDLVTIGNAVHAQATTPNVDKKGGVDVNDVIFVAKIIGASSVPDVNTAVNSQINGWSDNDPGVVFNIVTLDAWILQAAQVDSARAVLTALKGLLVSLADVDGNSVVNMDDFRTLSKYYGKPVSENPAADVNRDGVIDLEDSVLVLLIIGNASRNAPTQMHLQHAADVRIALEEARQLNTDPATIATLEQLLARLVQAETPKKTALLTNYPNPFNPETWIPYQLSTSAKVHIAIYAADGRLVRTLDLGHLPAGRYHEKSHAAYWDGRNAQGEPVASGLYFYTFTAGEFTATKKMLILK